MAGIFRERLKAGDPLAKIHGEDLQSIDDILSDLEVYNGMVQRNGKKWIIIPNVQSGTITNQDVKESIEVDGSDFKAHLVNDEDSPGASEYYGTDTASDKGWYPLSTAAAAAIEDTANLADSTQAGTVPSTNGKTHRMVLQLNASLKPTWQFLEADS